MSNALAMCDPNDPLSREKFDPPGFTFTDDEVVTAAERIVNGFSLSTDVVTGQTHTN